MIHFSKILDVLGKHPERTFVALAFIAAAPNVILGPYSYIRWHDFGDSHFSRYMSLVESVKSHGFHYWYVFGNGGVDMLTNGMRQTDIFFASFFILPPWLATGIFRFAQVFLAGYFFFRLMREDVRLDPGSAVFGGLIIACLQNNLMEHFFGLGAVPFIIWAIGRLLNASAVRLYGATIFIGIAYAVSAFAHLTTVFVIPFIALWLIWVHPARTLRVIIVVSIFSLINLALQADMLSAMATNAGTSNRVAQAMAFDPLNFALPELLQPALLVTIGGVIAAGRPNRWGWFLIGTFVALLSLSIGQYYFRVLVGDLIPLLKGFNMLRFGENLNFVVAALGAWGIAQIRSSASLDRNFSRGLVAVLCIGIALWPLSARMFHDARDWVLWGGYTANFNAQGIKKIALESRTAEVPFRVATIQENGLQPAYSNAYGLESIDNYMNLYRNSFRTFWTTVISPYLKRDAAKQAYFKTGGSRLSLYTDDGHGLPIHVDDYFQVPLLALANVRYLITTVPLDHPDLRLLKETKPDVFWDTLSSGEKIRRRFMENFSGKDVMVYRVTTEFPRWRLTDHIRTGPSRASRIADMAGTDHHSAQSTTWLEQKDAERLSEQPMDATEAKIKPIIYSPDHIVLRTQAVGATVLNISNMYSEFWHVTVDGTAARLMQANGPFQAVALPPGAHRVVFRYAPPYGILGSVDEE